MGCIIEFTESQIRFDFCQNKYKQKLWIDALLRYGKADLAGLAHVINVPAQTLYDVFTGTSFLTKKHANLLGQLFLIYFSN